MAGGGSTVYCYKFNNLFMDLFLLPLSYPFAPGNFAEKHVLNLVKRFSVHCCVLKC